MLERVIRRPNRVWKLLFLFGEKIHMYESRIHQSRIIALLKTVMIVRPIKGTEHLASIYRSSASVMYNFRKYRTMLANLLAI